MNAPSPDAPRAAGPDLGPLREALLAAERVVLTSHMRPDGDALGSELAAALFLQKLGKEAVILNTDPEPRPLGWLMDEVPDGLVHVYEPGRLEHAEWIARADAVLVLDTGSARRIGDALGSAVSRSTARKLLLDHHPDPEPWFDVAVAHTPAGSTGELVYALIAGHDAGLIDRAIATALYTAIVTDTGSFRYSGTTSETHRVVADLLERGDLRPEPLHIALFDGRSPEGLRLLSRALDTIATHYEGRLATMYVTQEMIRESGAFFDETEGLISYALSLETALAAVIALETPSGIKLSFRSKGDCPINVWANRFGGGGHANASGAYVRDKPLRRVIKDVIDTAPRHIASPHAPAPDDDDGTLSPDDLALLASFKGKL